MEEMMSKEYEVTLKKFLLFFAKVQAWLESAADEFGTSHFGKWTVYGVEYSDIALERDTLALKEVAIGRKKPVWWSLREQCVVIIG
jgi:hypothetical protein